MDRARRNDFLEIIYRKFKCSSARAHARGVNATGIHTGPDKTRLEGFAAREEKGEEEGQDRTGITGRTADERNREYVESFRGTA